MTASDQHTVVFRPSGRGKARCAPDPQYPHGIAIPAPEGVISTCHVKLPYPAPECGYWVINCRLCHCSIAVTAAGRPDDPVSVEMLCTIPPEVN